MAACALAMAVSFLFPILALSFNITFVNVGYPAFLVHVLPTTFVLVALASQWRSYGVYRPVDAKLLSWEAIIFVFARWPWMLLGSAMAVRDWLTGGYVDFRVTPKGGDSVAPLPARVLLPYTVLSLLSALPAIFVSNAGEASGFYIFAIVNAVTYAVVFAVAVIWHALENPVRRAGWGLRPSLAAAVAALLFALPMAAANQNGMEGVNSIAWGAGYFRLTEVTYSVAGAGHTGRRAVTFHPRWAAPQDAENCSSQVSGAGPTDRYSLTAVN